VVKIHRKPVTVKGTESCMMPLELKFREGAAIR
jgi:hypothetical protein